MRRCSIVMKIGRIVQCYTPIADSATATLESRSIIHRQAERVIFVYVVSRGQQRRRHRCCSACALASIFTQYFFVESRYVRFDVSTLLELVRHVDSHVAKRCFDFEVVAMQQATQTETRSSCSKSANKHQSHRSKSNRCHCCRPCCRQETIVAHSSRRRQCRTSDKQTPVVVAERHRLGACRLRCRCCYCCVTSTTRQQRAPM
jgi:hypothetical protein